MTQEELEEQGSKLSDLAHKKGLSALDDIEIKTLSLYEDWKDGADWEIVQDMSNSRTTWEAQQYLLNNYGYKEVKHNG